LPINGVVKVNFKLENDKGATIIELILALVIVAALSAAIYGVYIMGTGTYRKGHSQIEIQQAIRAALDRITRDLRGSTSIFAGRIARNNVSSTYDTYDSTTGISPDTPARVVIRKLALTDSGEILKTSVGVVVTYSTGGATIPAGTDIWEIIVYGLVNEGSDYQLKRLSFTAIQDYNPPTGLQPEEATWFYSPFPPNLQPHTLARNIEPEGLIFDYHGAFAPYANAREIKVTLKAQKTIIVSGKELTSSAELISTAVIRNQ
jgi:type II secretory pathway pseudopilin PulG